jgi:diaminopimelate epimerase
MIRVISQAHADDAEISLPDVDLPRELIGMGTVPGEQWLALGSVGVPHMVVRVDDIERADVLGRGRRLRSDPAAGPVGANVNFVGRNAAAESPWLIRTFERGVEGETLACGTGTVASALALAARAEAELPMRFRSRGGPELTVRANLEGARATNIWLAGEGRLLFRGVWEGRDDE